MADAMLSAAAERLFDLIEEQARHQRRRSTVLRLEQVAHEIEDVVDEWDYFLLKHQIQKRGSLAVDAITCPFKPKVCSFVPSSSSLYFKKVAVRHNIGKKIMGVKAKLDEVLKERDRYGFVISEPSVDPWPGPWRDQSTSMIDLTKVHGRDKDRDLLVTKLMDNGGGPEESGFRILSIVGTGGLGKTTLAQMVYNHSQVEESFELRIWICVSDPFNMTLIVKGILENIKVGSSPNTDNLNVLFNQVKESISGKKFLLVLDDVWTEHSDKWELLQNPLRCGGAGSKILVTSRSERVVKMMGTRESEIYRLELLSDEDCWSLLCRTALSGRNEAEYEDIGKRIAKKCKGLPLAAKTLGSLLRFKSSLEQWRHVLNSEMWQMEEAGVDIFPHLLLSYNELSPTLKRCFSYCAIFPKDTKIDVESLIENWMALGYLGSNVGDMEIKGREYFDVPAMRSLFQDFVKSDMGEIKWCKMHDIVHDFVQFLNKRGRLEATRMKRGTTCRVCDPSHVSMVNDFRTLYVHIESRRLPNCKCLAHLRVLRSSISISIPQGMENFIHLRRLALTWIVNLSREDLKAIFKLYHLHGLTLLGCCIEEIPKEIENLIHLRFLDLSQNYILKELPESICNLQELQTLRNERCDSLCRVPERLLHKLSEFLCGIGGSKLESLKKLNKLRGHLRLKFILDGDGDLNEVVEDARKAELKNEIYITEFVLYFDDKMGEDGSSSLSWVWMDVMDALEPHLNLSKLEIWSYGGSKLPRWMVSPLNQLKNLDLYDCRHLTSLPRFGKLPCLEGIKLWGIEGVEILGQEFLGITIGEGDGEDVISFPKLKKLELTFFKIWKVWEDISVEEECVIMPCLTDLGIFECKELRMLPHRLLRKVSSLKTLDITGSTKLKQCYGDKDGSDWKSISMNNPALNLTYY